ncbi:MAG: DNA polymerase III subunit gamma/tau, partial [Actinomycetota bacterium]|nr:DNA polymerase III subunit gamma/tau [Actinomycetota bacterium]
MKHATLYRKWRPRAFGGIVGQEPVVRTLRRAIEQDRVSHAYLFSGPRGTGKTSTAKVLAMGLNCENGPTAEPDGTCESCRSIVNNSSMDVLEMDAASNRGIDEIRELRDKVNLAPAAGRMKIYIIDEVHMLTTEAFNALLKMLEEPPEHVVFVLATTEKHKVLPTIISRCQSFDFRRPSIETLAEKLKEISTAEEIEAEPEALTVIAREGHGSFRDAEGLLDQLSSFAEGRITAAMVRELLGSVGPETLVETTYALHQRRAADALRIVDRLSNEGKDLGQFVNELLAHLRNVMLLPHAPEIALAEVGAEERAPLEEQANTVPTAEVVRLVEALGNALNRVKRGGDPKLELELTFLKLARDYTEPSIDALLGRLETLEQALANGAPMDTPRIQTATQTKPPEPQTNSPETIVSEESRPVEVAEETPEAAPEEGPARDDGPVEENGGSGDVDLGSEWSRIVSELKRRKQALTAAVYGEARVEGFDGHTLRLIFPEEQSFHVGMAKDRKHADELCKVLEKRLGHRPHLEVRAESEPRSASATPPAPLESPVEEEPPEDEPSPFVEEPPEDESPPLEEEPMPVEEARDESSNGGAE